MSTTTPTTPPSSSPTSTSNSISRASLIHNLSLGALVVCPIIILIPPRKLDIYTVALTAGFFAGGNQLAQEYTGSSIVSRFGARVQSMASTSLPPKAVEAQRRLREEKEARALAMGANANANTVGRIDAKSGREGEKGVLAEVRRKQEEREEQEKVERGLLEKVWMGSEGEDWKAKRDQREKEAIEDGRGYGGLIMDQIWEVWNGGKDKVEEVKEIDEKVVQERKGGKK